MKERNDECRMMNDELSPQFDPATESCHSSFIIHHSSFCLLLDPPASGPWNMAVDETLLESAADDGQCTLRFYRWQQPTLSLGYFQTYADRWRHEPSSRSAAVRRASGGGAIMHDIELTYSFAVPSRHPLAIDRLGFYRAMHTTLIEALAEWRIEACMVGENQPPAIDPGCKESSFFSLAQAFGPGAADRPSLDVQPFLCFQRRSPGDVLVGRTKVAGSAQRRCRGAVLQHGSVLLARSPAAPELAGLKELVDKTIGPEELAESWLARLGATMPGNLPSGRLSDAQRRRAAVLATEKYGSAAWTENRGRGENL
jgi:lipoate-protein ligase A